MVTPTASESLDQILPDQYIASGTYVRPVVDDSGGLQVISHPVNVDLDIKAMRKLKEGDTISFQVTAGAAATWVYAGTIDLWFKE